MDKPTRIEGVITVKNGQVTNLKNVTDLNTAFVDEGDLAKVLTALTGAGWKLEGDYQLRISKNVGEPPDPSLFHLAE